MLSTLLPKRAFEKDLAEWQGRDKRHMNSEWAEARFEQKLMEQASPLM